MLYQFLAVPDGIEEQIIATIVIRIQIDLMTQMTSPCLVAFAE